MKEINVDNFYMDLCQNTYEELTLVESLITAIQESCLNLESNSQYYENTDNFILKISKERNMYINLLSIARERLKNIEILNTKMENEVITNTIS